MGRHVCREVTTPSSLERGVVVCYNAPRDRAGPEARLCTFEELNLWGEGKVLKKSLLHGEYQIKD